MYQDGRSASLTAPNGPSQQAGIEMCYYHYYYYDYYY